ncbi:Glucans biosynthesis protein C [Thalassocella blandensis]|nr:Glucans biosynthesis protein C [Thalassocella blandensis]
MEVNQEASPNRTSPQQHEVDGTPSTGTRYFYMDNLRAIAMLAGIVFHAALAYSLLLHEGWPTADTSSSVAIDFVAWFMHMFRMPLFFLISGFFACYLIQKRGNLGFIKNRLLRIALPFIVFWPLVFIAVVGSLVYAASSTQVNTPIINFIRLGMENPDMAGQEQSPVTSMHLWFLYYLFFFCLATLILNATLRLPERLKVYISHPVTLVIGLPLITSVAFFKQHLPHAAPESFKPMLWPFLYYGSFFFVGWIFYQKQNMIQQLRHWVYPMLAVSIACYAVFFYLSPKELSITELMAGAYTLPELTTQQVILSLCTSIISWHMTLLCIIGAVKFLNHNNQVIRFVADSSYWLYIVHIPILFGLQIFFHTIEWPIFIELPLSIGITFAVGLLSYTGIIRPSPIGWMLNGKKDVKNTVAADKQVKDKNNQSHKDMHSHVSPTDNSIVKNTVKVQV